VTAPLSWSYRATEIPEAGLSETRTATAAERAAIAAALDIVACDAFKVDYRVRALGGGRYAMSGRLTARATQQCVVTLEPVAQEIVEDFEVEFWPAGTLPEVGDAEVEVLSVPDIEPLQRGTIDAGRVFFELLAASIDPYPRKPGASFSWEEPAGDTSAQEAGPFAGLKKLKK